MVESGSARSQRRRFSIQEHLRDPEVRAGYDEQGIILEAARLIRGMREAARLTQEVLARRLGTSQAHLSVLENGTGRQGPTFLMLSRIAEACGQELQISAKPSATAEHTVEDLVKLREEAVSVERRPEHSGLMVPSDPFRERVIDVAETAEETVVSKTARVMEEVVVKKEAAERTETVRDTVRSDETRTGDHEASSRSRATDRH